MAAGTTCQTAVSADGNSNVSAWLDSNQDGVFDPSEWTRLAVVTQNGQPTVATLLVPATAQPGPTGLRIRSRTAGSPNTATDACDNFLSGEVEDYIVTIAVPTATRPAAGTLTVRAYPNPGSDVISMAYTPPANAPAGGQLQVRDALGRTIHRQQVAAAVPGLTELSVKSWSAGWYSYVIIWPGNATSTGKFSVQH